jgi:hypothetical protein
VLTQILISASATILLVVGILHLRALFFSAELRPKDADLEAGMKRASPGVSSLTTMWRCWVGFNAIMSIGLMLFGALYGYLSIFQLPVLRQAPFLLLAGALFLASLVAIARRYLFDIPVLVFAIAFILYAAGAVAAGV